MGNTECAVIFHKIPTFVQKYVEGINSAREQTYSAQYLKSSSEAYFVSVCTVVLSVRRTVVELHVDAVVNMAMTQLPFEDYKA